MNEYQYKRITGCLESHPCLKTAAKVFNGLLTLLGFAMYPFLLYRVFIRDRRPGSKKNILDKSLRFLAWPFMAFVLLSAYRKKKNMKRPYEIYDIRPAIGREKKGHSFPSRHVFSLMLIGMLWIPFSPPLAVFLLLAACFLAVVRVAGGVHFIKDVIAGALIGIVSGLAAILPDRG